MKPETKEWLNDKALIARDWIVAHPWPVATLAAFVAGAAVGLVL